MFTVADLYNLPLLKSANVLTGTSGLNRQIEATGIMDHECNSSKISEEFYPGDLILSSFLILEETPEMIPEVIKELIDTNISCIGISDLYLSEIPQETIQYAIENDFSIFFFSKEIPFEDIIITVFDRIHSDDNAILFTGQFINDLMKNSEDSAQIKNIVSSMGLTINDELSVIFASGKNGFSFTEYNMTVNAISLHPFFSGNSTVLYKRNALAIILSSPIDENGSHMKLLLKDFLALAEKRDDIHIGMSSKSSYASDVGLLMQQASDTCQQAALVGKKYMEFKDMGIFAALYPMSRTKWGKQYIRDTLYPLIGAPDSDNKKTAALLETLKYYVHNDKNIKKTAIDMNQHENTVRYRIKQITELMKIDKDSNKDWLKLELAVYLYFIQNSSSNY